MRTDILGSLKKQSSVSEHLHLTHLNSPNIMENSMGMLMSTIEIEGHTFDTETDEKLNELVETWHRAMCSSFDESFGVYCTIHRKKIDIKLKGDFKNNFQDEVNSQYYRDFSGSSYENKIYITVVKKGITTGVVGVGNKLKKFFLDLGLIKTQSIVDIRHVSREESCKKLDAVSRRLVMSLSDFKPRLLGDDDLSLGYSELLQFYGIFINAGENIPLNFQNKHRFKGVADAEKNQTAYPMGNIGQNLCRYNHILFGKNIQFLGINERDVKFGSMLSLKNYSTKSCSIMLDSLLDFEGEYILTHSFLFQEGQSAIKKIDRRITARYNANNRAHQQTEDLYILQQEIAGEDLKVGYHHNSLMLLDASQETLEKNIERIIKRYLSAGIIANQETLGQEATFWAQVPGQQKYICRSTIITTKNFCDMFPLHNYKIGKKCINHLGNPVALATTPGKTPVFFHLHSEGSKDNPSSGHTLVFGGNGSGKTAMMAFLDSQLSRFGGRSYFFDRNCGCEIYIRASGGSYFVLSPDQQDLKFNPFQLDENASNKEFLSDFICQMLSDDGVLDDTSKSSIKDGVDFVFSQLPREDRCLSNFAKHLPVDFKKSTRLKTFLRGEGGEPDGLYAYLFDNDTDDLRLTDKVGFDLTHYLSSDKNKTILSLIAMYMFHVIEAKVSSSELLDTIFLDEGWQYLENDYFQSKLKEWLGTLRKCNAHVVFGSQSANQMLASPISSTLLDNCSTKLLFANPDGKREVYCDGLGLNEAEYQQIIHMKKQDHYFLYKRDQQSSICKFDLSSLGKNMRILSGTPANVAWVRQELKNSNKNWVEDLKTRGENGEN